ncbi:unnamed protein product [Gadus morhua 'NCC']
MFLGVTNNSWPPPHFTTVPVTTDRLEDTARHRQPGRPAQPGRPPARQLADRRGRQQQPAGRRRAGARLAAPAKTARTRPGRRQGRHDRQTDSRQETDRQTGKTGHDRQDSSRHCADRLRYIWSQSQLSLTGPVRALPHQVPVSGPVFSLLLCVSLGRWGRCTDTQTHPETKYGTARDTLTPC